MIKRVVTLSLVLGNVVLGFTASAAQAAEPLMTKAQYEDYSVQYRCAESKFHDDLEKKEAEIMRIEQQFGLSEDSFEAMDALTSEYENDDALLERINARVLKDCPE